MPAVIIFCEWNRMKCGMCAAADKGSCTCGAVCIAYLGPCCTGHLLHPCTHICGPCSMHLLDIRGILALMLCSAHAQAEPRTCVRQGPPSQFGLHTCLPGPDVQHHRGVLAPSPPLVLHNAALQLTAPARVVASSVLKALGRSMQLLPSDSQLYVVWPACCRRAPMLSNENEVPYV